VARPKELGGLGLFDMRNLSWALRARWPWLQLTELDRPWNQFQLQVPKEVQSLIDMAVLMQVGDGSNTRFWTDRWLNGKRIRDIAPAIYALVPRRIRNRRSVRDALVNLTWISDFHGAMLVSVLVEYLELFQEFDQVVLQPGVADKHIWWLTSKGNFTSKSAYMALFQGAIPFQPADRVWKSWAPSKCTFFIWLVEHNRCWTADRLAKRDGLPGSMPALRPGTGDHQPPDFLHFC
jgi:hypothetical protein